MRTSREVLLVLEVVCRDLVDPPSNFELVDDVLWCDGCCNADLIDPDAADEDLIVSLAEAVQGFVANGPGDQAWPVCPDHGFGLHPEVSDGDSVWMCRPHGHVVAQIGRLRAPTSA